MPPKVQKSKAAKALAAMSGGKGGKKKKWAKTKMREKKNHRVIFTKSLHKKIMDEIPKKMKVITIYNVIENYKINGALARRTLKELHSKGKIKQIAKHAQMPIYTKVGGKEEAKE